MKRMSCFAFSIVICLSSVFFQSCANTNDDEIKQLTMKFHEVMNEKDIDALVELYADDAVMIMAGESEPLKGKESLRANQEGWFRAFPDMKIDFGMVLTSKNEFCIEMLITGTNTGPLSTSEGEIPPTGRTVKFNAVFLAKVSPEGLVTEDRTYFDNMGFMSQLGLSITPPAIGIQEAIAAANDKFMALFKQGDAAGLSTLYTEDGQFLAPNSGVVTGRPAIQAAVQSIMDTGVKAAKLETTELESHGGIVNEVGRFEMYNKSGQVLDKGKYIVIWKQEQEQWKLHRDIFNSSMPKPK